MGVAADAARVLRSEHVRFAPGMVSGGTSSWTLRDALVAACGCDRHAGHLAYWQWETVQAALKAVRSVLASSAGLPPTLDVERWANQPTRTAEEVLEVLESVQSEDDVEVSEAPSMRSWCDPKIVVTCRIPYIPLAALVHAWGDRERPWSDLVAEFRLAPDLSSWDLLRRVDPAIRDLPAPQGVQDAARQLRAWQGSQSASVAPVRWLFAVTDDSPETALDSLLQRAGDARAPAQVEKV